MDVYAAPEWHYWIAVILTPGAILTVAAVGAGYIAKVVRPKYPPRYKKPTAGS
jgi:hypothetical protein